MSRPVVDISLKPVVIESNAMMVTLTNPPTGMPPKTDSTDVAAILRSFGIALLEEHDSASDAPGVTNVAVRTNDRTENHAIPAAIGPVLKAILTQLSLGQPVTLIPFHAELSTYQAAGILNVSHRYFEGLLDEKAIPYTSRGTVRFVRYDELMFYKERDDAERRKVLNELTAEAQELGLGY